MKSSFFCNKLCFELSLFYCSWSYDGSEYVGLYGITEMVLVEGTPVHDIAHVGNIAGVMVRGDYFSGIQLSEMMKELEG